MFLLSGGIMSEQWTISEFYEQDHKLPTLTESWNVWTCYGAPSLADKTSDEAGDEGVRSSIDSSARFKYSTTSRSSTCVKSTKKCPTASNGSGIMRTTNSSTCDRTSRIVDGGPTGITPTRR